MDILRLDAEDSVYFVRADTVLAITAHETDPAKTVVLLDLGGNHPAKVVLLSDVEEVSAMLETNYHAARIYRIN